MTTEPQPCPFCGDAVSITWREPDWGWTIVHASANDRVCSMMDLRYFNTHQEALTDWNTRKTTP